MKSTPVFISTMFLWALFALCNITAHSIHHSEEFFSSFQDRQTDGIPSSVVRNITLLKEIVCS